MSQDPLKSVKPTTLSGLKRLAKKMKKSYDIQYSVALDRAAVQAGFQNYRHALSQLDPQT